MITAQQIISLEESSTLDLKIIHATEAARNNMESYFKNKFQKVDFKIERTPIAKNIFASGKIFIEQLAVGDFKENEKISQQYALNLWKQLKNANTVPQTEGMLVEVRLPRHPHPAFSTIIFFDDVIQIMVSPPKNRITTLENDAFLRLYVFLGNVYTFSSKETSIEDYFMDVSSLDERLEAIRFLQDSVKQIIDSVIKAIRLIHLEE